jgi:hypothetical protein
MARFETGERWQGNRWGTPKGIEGPRPAELRALVNEILEKDPGEVDSWCGGER